MITGVKYGLVFPGIIAYAGTQAGFGDFKIVDFLAMN